ncbi:SDR family NAD(P)-dependent oxidoreductase [Mycobacterium sp. PDNC021]|uniref:SDR family NAD(P)-dependent oxidoreductase n=1 Tax=Mycobacterium sp. PDNC021 TaxID=3391399 RepID=UPI003AB046F0
MSSALHAANSVADKVVAITGAARGIGFATAKALTAAGARVIIGDIDEDMVRKAASDLGITGVKLDVTQRDSFAAFLDRTEVELGPVDVLINNAGIMPTGPLLGYDEELIRRTIDIDLLAVISGSQLAADRMLRRASGHIINVASIAGRLPAPGLSLYTAAKFGVVGFSESLNAELESEGVRVSTVQPMHTATDLIAGLSTGGIPPTTPERVARTILKVIRTQQLHAYPIPGLGVVAAAGALPGGVKRRLLRSPRIADIFMVANDELRETYNARIGKGSAAPIGDNLS